MNDVIASISKILGSYDTGLAALSFPATPAAIPCPHREQGGVWKSASPPPNKGTYGICPVGPRALGENQEPMKRPPLLSPIPVPAGERFLSGSGDRLISFHRLAPRV